MRSNVTFERSLNEQRQASELVEQYQSQHQVRLDDEMVLEQERERHLEQLDVLAGEQEELRDLRGDLRRSQQDAEAQIQTLQNKPQLGLPLVKRLINCNRKPTLS